MSGFGHLDIRKLSVRVDNERDHHPALQLAGLRLRRITQVLGEPLHHLGPTTRKLRQLRETLISRAFGLIPLTQCFRHFGLSHLGIITFPQQGSPIWQLRLSCHRFIHCFQASGNNWRGTHFWPGSSHPVLIYRLGTESEVKGNVIQHALFHFPACRHRTIFHRHITQR